MAAVYLATQKTLGRRVALKIMDRHTDESFAERFLNEGRLIASLRHPNVITIYDLGMLEDGRAFISMEFIDGGDLENRLRQPITEDEAISILRSLADCLDYIHRNDVIHRDIKPANILFRKDGTLVLTDFGIAKQIDNNNVKLTRDGIAVGSPGYMSPEQAQAQAVDPRTDIYSVGVIFSEMLLGQNLFEADSYIQTSMNHIQMDLPILPPELSRLQTMLDKMLAKDPNDRFSDAAALLNYIEMLPYIDEMPNLDSMPELPGEAAPPMRVSGSYSFNPQPVVEDEPEAPPPKKKGLFSLIASNDSLIFGVILLALIGVGVFFAKQVQLSAYLNNAEKAMEANRLMAPEENNAYFFYQEVLKKDPLNQKAKEGLARIAVIHNENAERALALDQLTTPEEDNAFSHFQQALVVEPGNARAKEGIVKLATRYAELAEQARKSRNREKMREYIDKGLQISPDDARLLEMKIEYR